MKIINISDWHLRSTPPFLRTDDFAAAQLGKVRQIVDICNQHDAVLAAAGDIFDSMKIGYGLLNSVMRELDRLKNPFVFVPGNHDSPNHNPDLSSSPLQTLTHLPTAVLLTAENPQFRMGEVCFTGTGWEQEPPPPAEHVPYNVLVYHVSVYEDKIPFFMEGKAYTAKTLKKKFPGFDYYLVGDIHLPFVKDGVVCSGPLMRDELPKADYRPRVYLIDTDTGEIEPIFLEVEKDVFPANLLVEEDQPEDYSDHIKGLISSLKMTAEVPKYDQVCLDLAKEDEAVTQILEETFDEYR